MFTSDIHETVSGPQGRKASPGLFRATSTREDCQERPEGPERGIRWPWLVSSRQK